MISKTTFVPKYDKNKIKKPTRVIFAALLPLHPYFCLPYIKDTKIIQASIDNIVL
jgi:hypothetical protein